MGPEKSSHPAFSVAFFLERFLFTSHAQSKSVIHKLSQKGERPSTTTSTAQLLSGAAASNGRERRGVKEPTRGGRNPSTSSASYSLARRLHDSSDTKRHSTFSFLLADQNRSPIKRRAAGETTLYREENYQQQEKEEGSSCRENGVVGDESLFMRSPRRPVPPLTT